MAKKNTKLDTKVDDFLELLKDERVTESIVSLIKGALAPVFEDIVNRLIGDFDGKLEKQNQKILSLEEDTRRIETRLEAFEVDARSNNLLIHGLEESTLLSDSDEPQMDRDVPHSNQEESQMDRDLSHSNQEESQMGRDLPRSDRVAMSARSNQEAMLAVLTLCNTRLKLDVSQADISTAFRLQQKGKDRFRPILVKFTTQRIRNLVYASRLALKKNHLAPHATPVYINEHLTKGNARVYAEARSLVKQKKLFSSWTMAGYVYVRLSEDQGGKKLKILSMQSLDEFRRRED